MVFEYPREAPKGEQMDFVEVMELNDDGLIHTTRSTGDGEGLLYCRKMNITGKRHRSGRRSRFYFWPFNAQKFPFAMKFTLSMSSRFRE